MINKKNLLGKVPQELGDKDAIHVAIVAVRAGATVQPGQRCELNEHREAIPAEKGVGVADPFLKGPILTGTPFWLLLNQDAVPNVRHVWDIDGLDFSPPNRGIEYNSYIAEIAVELGVTYEQLMEACDYVTSGGTYGWREAKYPGTLDANELEKALDEFDSDTLWSEWSDETGYEFENQGSACCPEYDYPDTLFATH